MKLFLVDDHALFREGLQSLFSQQPDFEVVGYASTAQEAIDKVPALKPDAILIDVDLAGDCGWDALKDIISSQPQTSVVVLTNVDTDEYLLEALRCGAQGYILKSVPFADLLAELRVVSQGEVAISRSMATRLVSELRRLLRPDGDPRPLGLLTSRELEVLRYIGAGASNGEIARHLVISEHTVKVHVRNILAKLKLKNRSHAANFAQRYGFSSSLGKPGNGAGEGA